MGQPQTTAKMPTAEQTDDTATEEASILADLESVEATLNSGAAGPASTIATDAPLAGAGRAAYSSVASTLVSVRSRLTSALGDGGSPAGESAEPPAAVASVAAAGPGGVGLGVGGGLRQLSARLRRAEFSHSRRIPLGLIDDIESRRMPSVPPSTASMLRGAGLSLRDVAESDASDAAVDASSTPTRGGDGVGARKDDGDDIASSSSQKLQRNSSVLLASRRLADAASEHADAALHREAVQGLPNLISIDEVPDGVETTIPHTLSDLDEGNESPDVEVEDPAADNVETEAAPPAMPSGPGRSILYSWGNGSSGALLHDGTKDRVLTPSAARSDGVRLAPDSRLGRRAILTIGASRSHTAASTASGEVLGCGDNAEGAVDPSRCGDEPEGTLLPRPVLLESLAASRVVQVSCGLEHTAAVSAGGAVLTWGSNAYGQLGHRSGLPPVAGGADALSPPVAARRRRPLAAVVLGAGRRAASVTCGGRFTLVLTDRMWVLACGADAGEGGSSEDDPPAKLRDPAPIPALEGLPVVSLAAGNRHATAVTALGAAYAWGGNSHGCCGREVPKVGLLSTPSPVRIPGAGVAAQPKVGDDDSPAAPQAPCVLSPEDDVAIANAACGDEHTVLVTRSGRLFVCGRNDKGQLGLDVGKEGSSVSFVRPVPHPDAEHGRRFKSAAAGTEHTLLLDDRGDVYQLGGSGEGWGSDGSGPQRVLAGKLVLSVAAGGGQSFAISSDGRGAGGLRRQFSVQADTAVVKDGGGFAAERIRSLADAVSRENGAIYGEVSDATGAVGDELPLGTAGRDLARRVEDLLRSPAVLNGLFANPADLDAFYKQIVSAGPLRVRMAVVSAIDHGVRQGLEVLQKGGARFLYPETVRCLLMYLQCPLFGDCAGDAGMEEAASTFDSLGEVFLALCELVLSLPFEGYRSLVSWALAAYPRSLFAGRLVRNLLVHLDAGLPAEGVAASAAQRRSVPVVVALLRWFHGAAERAGSDELNPEDYYSDAISSMDIETLYEDMRRYKSATPSQRSSNFYLCAHPFLLTAEAKRNLLQMDNQMEMVKAATAGLSYDVQQRAFVFDPYFVLAIDRKYLLQQTLQKVEAAAPGDLRKQLKIIFKGEDGVDAGGVTKEFFQLLVANLFDVNTGMWKDDTTGDDEGQVHWFNGDCSWNADGYHLVGVLVGLALYNSVLLDVHFPRAVYRKVLRLPLGLEDVVDAETRKGLRMLLEYDGEVEDIFCLTFEVTWTDFGQERSTELKPGGADVPVTNRNREEYVMMYVSWLLVDSVREQYDAFETGFMRVMEGSFLDLLRPEELELLVVGTPDLDFAALEKNTEYEGGFDESTDVVKCFWRFTKTADTETQIKLLKFCTGTSRAPIGGLGAMPFKIQKAGPDSMQLPTSHTCFNTLLLPDYGDNYEKLADRLGRAVLECEGFGLQ